MRLIARFSIAFAVAATALPAPADAASHRSPAHAGHRSARIHALEHRGRHHGVCLDTPVEVVARGEVLRFSLARCDGSAAPLAAEHLTTVARAAAVEETAGLPSAMAVRPRAPVTPAARAAVARPRPALDPGLAERLERIVDHVRRPGRTARVVLVADRPSQATGSYHARGRALDFRVEGVDNVKLVDLCKKLPDTGCGYFPNDSFVHMDVRDRGTGHVAWTDTSRPGEPSRFARDADARLPNLPQRPLGAAPAPASDPQDTPERTGDEDAPAIPATEHDPAFHTL